MRICPLPFTPLSNPLPALPKGEGEPILRPTGYKARRAPKGALIKPRMKILIMREDARSPEGILVPRDLLSQTAVGHFGTWCAMQGLNLRLLACEASALPLS